MRNACVRSSDMVKQLVYSITGKLKNTMINLYPTYDIDLSIAIMA